MNRTSNILFDNSLWKSKLSIYEKLVAVSFAFSIPHAKALTFGVLLTIPLLLTGDRPKVKLINNFLLICIIAVMNGMLLTAVYFSSSYDKVDILNIGAHMINYSVLLVALSKFASIDTLIEFIAWRSVGSIIFANPYVGQGFSAYWKYVLGIPITVILLYLSRRNLRLTYLTAVGLIFFSVSEGFRSLALTLIGSLLIYWFSVDNTKVNSRQRKVLSTAIGILGLLFISILVISFATNGKNGGNYALHIGSIQVGRIEFFSGVQFMLHHLMGFGLGALPSPDIIYSAESYLVNGGFHANNVYMLNFLLSGNIKFHSFILDAWSSFGIFGLVVGLIALSYGVRGILQVFRLRTFGPLMAFVLLQGLWDTLFSPFISNGQSVICMIAIGVFLVNNRIQAPAKDEIRLIRKT